MAPTPDSFLSLLPRSFLAETNHAPTINSDTRSLSPMDVQALHLAKRADRHVDFSAGTKPPDAFDNKGFQALFAIIGMGMVLTALWFFFWAKNGGFKWGENDWEDYKSTVLRRKGPDGKTLSNATKSTRLGGGSVVHGGSYGAESSVGYTDETATSADLSEMREVEEGRGVGAFGLRGGDASKKKHRREGTNNYKDQDVRAYREEKPARVGGLNRKADGVYTDFSNTGSDLGSNVSSKPLVTVSAKEKKKEEKAKEARAKERMRQAKLIEKNAARTAAAEEKARKAAEKEQAKREKAEQKKAKKSKRADTEATSSEAPMSEAPMSEAPMSEKPMVKAPMTTYTASEAPRKSRRSPPSAAYSFVSGDDTNTVYTGAYTDNRTAPSEVNESSYYSDYRPNADPAALSQATRSRRDRDSRDAARSRHSSASPRKQHRASRDADAPSDMFAQANGNVQGTLSYPCYIPGLSSACSVGVSESVSQVGGPSHGGRRGRDVMDGYRRGGVRAVARRDSLSDSDA
ncbi:uncharacterized protein EI97DRAFT_436996 [Westerdykella ornata]|uniref:Uncharacterized protein n=1 Tax=Westerdykella ornata TaxID=318751 RepID=A0A6A6J8N6_WESOR|nr:uncharacterized protein EI97DRAFT_436996 [Westerdykella ornata]KAF2272368.1 hypothetical protein EI97DRAFT_436996 [Westerdykella ornata]